MAISLPIDAVFALITQSLLFFYLVFRFFFNFFPTKSIFLLYFAPTSKLITLLQRCRELKSKLLSNRTWIWLESGHNFAIFVLWVSTVLSIIGCALFFIAYMRDNDLRYLDATPFLLWKTYDSSVQASISRTTTFSNPFLFAIAQFILHSALIFLDFGLSFILSLYFLSSYLLHAVECNPSSSTPPSNQFRKSKKNASSSVSFMESHPIRFRRQFYVLVFFHFFQIVFTFTLFIVMFSFLLVYKSQSYLLPGPPVFSFWMYTDYFVFGLFIFLAFKLSLLLLFAKHVPWRSYFFVSFTLAVVLNLDFIFFTFTPYLWNNLVSYILQYSIVLVSNLSRVGLVLIFIHLPAPFICDTRFNEISEPLTWWPSQSTKEVATNTSLPRASSVSLSSNSNLTPSLFPAPESLPPPTTSFLMISSEPLTFPNSNALVFPSVSLNLPSTTSSPLSIISIPSLAPTVEKEPPPSKVVSNPAFSSSPPPRSVLSWITRTHGLSND